MKQNLRAYGRLLAQLPHFLNTPISADQARAVIARRLEQRNENFLRMVRRAVFDNPGSPYRPLLQDARCDYGDMVAELSRHDLETLLQRLHHAGVWIAFEEFKGRRSICRNGHSYRVSDADFDNPAPGGAFEAQTGGSTGRPSRMLLNLEYLEDRSCYEHLMFQLLDIYHLPLAVWYPRLPPSVGLGAVLRYAKIGSPAERWFDMQLGASIAPRWHAWALSLLLTVSRLSRSPLPSPSPAPLADPAAILAWIGGALQNSGRCVLQTNVSGATRISGAARAAGMELAGVEFVTGSEPLTPGKHAAIVATGARVFLRYHSVDIGTIASGCGNPEELDEMHLVSDSVAVVPMPPQTAAPDPRRLYLTSILGRGPKVMINVELGDEAVFQDRRCGCIFEESGFQTRICRVRSAVRSTAEGIALPFDVLAEISESVLVPSFGGSPTDYQWVEDEEQPAGGLTRVWLRIAPALGPMDESKVRAAVLAAMERLDTAHRLYARILGHAETIQVLREQPRSTAAGKTPPVMRDRSSGFRAPGETGY